MNIVESQAHNKLPRMLPGFHILIMLVFVCIPFGESLQAFFGGFTPAKVLVPILFIYLFSIQTTNLKLHPLSILYLSFIVLTLPSLVTGEGYAGIALSLIGYFFLLQILYPVGISFKKIKDLINAYLLGLTLVGFMTLQIFITGFDPGTIIGKPFIEFWFGVPIVSGTSNNQNGFATLFIIGVPFAFAFLLNSKNRIEKFAYFLCFCIVSITLLLTFSRSAIGGSIFACIVVHHHLNNSSTFSLKLIIKLATVLLTIVFFGSVFYLLIDFFVSDASSSETNFSSNKELSGGYRTMVLLPMLSIVAENPLMGVGFGNVKPMMEAKTGLYINSHNTPFGIAMDYGLLALIFFISTIGFAVRDYCRGIRLLRNSNNRLIISALLSSLGAMCFHALFHEIYIHIMLWTLVAMGPVVLRAAKFS